ncbi:MAG: nickel pincer cofactor biosynthesis protein LarB [Desulfobacterales bacterium]|nr:nickel pincer cofactor biosynthesis protein LarB [Desulfobacterales bacterium]MBS3754245.1 nickel pincer cofactor biosynthesis protein LarB [Desulfobacterales bacterium]
MNPEDLQKLLEAVANGRTQVSSAMEQLQHLSMEDIEYAHVDHHRSLRKGFPEVIFGEGKTADQIAGIMEKMVPRENIVLVTRVSGEKAGHLNEHFPGAVYHEDARMLILEKSPPRVQGKGSILVMSAGTSDIPVAKEAYLTAQAMGNRVEVVYDVGVAGIHRLFAHKEAIDRATVLIVAAGMEGALPSVVGGLVNRPVIGVPTSIGYGTSLGGLTPLFAMLNSCSSNVAVVNIDNGFGAGYLAAMINRE